MTLNAYFTSVDIFRFGSKLIITINLQAVFNTKNAVKKNQILIFKINKEGR